VVINGDLLLEAVGSLREAGVSAHAENVRVELGQLADDGGYFDVGDVADDLAELESLGELERDVEAVWEESGPIPKTRIEYVLPSE
jgi:hypothetical protein